MSPLPSRFDGRTIRVDKASGQGTGRTGGGGGFGGAARGGYGDQGQGGGGSTGYGGYGSSPLSREMVCLFANPASLAAGAYGQRVQGKYHQTHSS